MNISKIEKMKQISESLNLNFEMQDWGIINSSAERVSEFIDYFNENVSLSSYCKYDIFELIVASYNDAILGKLENEMLKSKFIYFLKENSDTEIYETIIYYWKRIKSEEFPVGYLL